MCPFVWDLLRACFSLSLWVHTAQLLYNWLGKPVSLSSGMEGFQHLQQWFSRQWLWTLFLHRTTSCMLNTFFFIAQLHACCSLSKTEIPKQTNKRETLLNGLSSPLSRVLSWTPQVERSFENWTKLGEIPKQIDRRAPFCLHRVKLKKRMNRRITKNCGNSD